MCRGKIENASSQHTYTSQQKTKNRKYASMNDTYKFCGDTYIVDARNKGLYTPILKSILGVLYTARHNWGRVLMIRFDLHHKNLHTEDSKHISKFFKNLIRKLERAYNTKLLYVWAREVGRKEQGQHYHCALFMDGNKVNQSYKVLEIAEKTWPYHFSKPQNPYYYIDSPEIMQEAVFRLSYLAKVNTKGKRKPEAHDYGCSRIGKNYK